MLGRGFAPNEGGPGRPNLIVLTHALWNRLGADRAIVGAQVRLQGNAYTVIGVLPPTFAFVRTDALRAPQRIDAFITFALDLASQPNDAGNFSAGQSAVNKVKAFDPHSGAWEDWPDLLQPRWYPGLARLADGRLLLFGGGQQPNAIRTATCEILDPRTQQSTPTGSLLKAGGFGPVVGDAVHLIEAAGRR